MSNARNIATVTDVKPMFSAYQSVAQSLAANTWTKIQFQTKEFDLTNAFDNVTNFRFQPTTAGYYQINALVSHGGSSNMVGLSVYKNGNRAKDGTFAYPSGSGTQANLSAIIYLNGTTDYAEIYSYITANLSLLATANNTYFQAHYIANGV